MFFLFPAGLFFPLLLQIYLIHQFALVDGVSKQFCQKPKDGFSFPKPQFHFGGMDVYVQKVSFYRNLKGGKRVFMLHYKGLVGFLNTSGNQAASDIPAVDKIIFKIPVPSGYQRFADKSVNGNQLIFSVHLYQIGGNIPSVHMVNNFLQTGIAGGVEFRLIIYNQLKRNLRMGQGQPLHQISDIAGFRMGRFQEFSAGGGVVKEITHQKRGSLRRSDFFQRLFFSPFNHITYAAQTGKGFGNQFHLRHRGNTGQCLSPESQGRYRK